MSTEEMRRLADEAMARAERVVAGPVGAVGWAIMARQDVPALAAALREACDEVERLRARVFRDLIDYEPADD